MELIECLHIIRKRLWIVLAITVFAALISAGVSIFLIDPVYEGKVTLIIGRALNTENDRVRYDDILMYQKLVKTYGELAKSRLIVDETISRLKYDTTYRKLSECLKVTTKGDTQILEIAIRDKSAEMAVQLVNTLSEVFIETVRTMMNREDVKLMDKAQLPDDPVKPQVILNIVIAAFMGFILSFGLVFVIEYLDNTIKTEEDIENMLGFSVLASLPDTHRT